MKPIAGLGSVRFTTIGVIAAGSAEPAIENVHGVVVGVRRDDRSALLERDARVFAGVAAGIEDQPGPGGREFPRRAPAWRCRHAL
jgi:tetrahydromethanopterin S-methyltransferase subunit F